MGKAMSYACYVCATPILVSRRSTIFNDMYKRLMLILLYATPATPILLYNITNNRDKEKYMRVYGRARVRLGARKENDVASVAGVALLVLCGLIDEFDNIGATSKTTCYASEG